MIYNKINYNNKKLPLGVTPGRRVKVCKTIASCFTTINEYCSAFEKLRSSQTEQSTNINNELLTSFSEERIQLKRNHKSTLININK